MTGGMSAADATDRAQLSIDFTLPTFSIDDHGVSPSVNDGVIINHIELTEFDELAIHVASHHITASPATTVSLSEILDGTVIIRATDDRDELILCNADDYSGSKFLAIHQSTLQTIGAHFGVNPETILSICPAPS